MLFDFIIYITHLAPCNEVVFSWIGNSSNMFSPCLVRKDKGNDLMQKKRFDLLAVVSDIFASSLR